MVGQELTEDAVPFQGARRAGNSRYSVAGLDSDVSSCILFYGAPNKVAVYTEQRKLRAFFKDHHVNAALAVFIT